MNIEGKYITKVHRKRSKTLVTKIPKQYTRNSITTGLHWAENITSNIKEKIQAMRKKFIKSDYHRPFVNSVINQYSNKTKE